MNTLRTLLVVFIATSAIPTYLNCMGRTKKTISVAGTGIHFGLAGWMFKKGVDRLLIDEDKEIEEGSVRAPKSLTKYAHTILEFKGIKNPTNIMVRINGDPSSPYAASTKALFIDIREAKRLVQCLGSLSDEQLDIYIDNQMGCSTHITWSTGEYITRSIACLGHEAHHLEHNDILRETAAHFIIPALTLLTSRYKPILALTGKSISTKILSGAFLHEANKLLLAAYKRHQEYAADDAVTEPAEMLMLIKDLNATSHAYPPNPSIYGLLKSSHPDPRYRIERMANRLMEDEHIKSGR